MGTELGNFARRFLTDVNRDRDHARKSANENESNQPGRYVSDAQRMVKRRQIVDWLAGMQKQRAPMLLQNLNRFGQHPFVLHIETLTTASVAVSIFTL